MNRLKNMFLIAITVTLLSCSKHDNSNIWKEKLTTDLNSLSNEILENNHVQIKNGILKVVVPSKGYEWNTAWGYANPKQNIVATKGDQFYAASIGKMTLATLTMMFVEQGQLNLDDPIKQYLPESVINGLHTYNGIDYSNKITVEQLLNHTSGLQDYFFDGDENSNELPDFIEVLLAQQDKIWKPIETINYVKMNLPPLFPPGKGYHYTDTEYVLMGMVLESITKIDLAEIYRQKLWEPLNLTHTYLNFRETAILPVAGASLSHTYLENIDITETSVLSADWAGGGIITTTQDLYRFMHAWVNNDIFQNSETKQLMTNYNPVSNYGLGNEKIKLAGFEGTLVGHTGANQSVMYYIPEYGAYIIGTFNQLNEDTINTFVKKTLSLLKNQIE